MLRVGEHIYRLNFKQSPCSNYAHNIMPAEPRSTVYRKWPLSIVFDKSRLSRYYYIKPDVGQRRVNMHNYVPFDRGGCIVYEREREREREKYIQTNLKNSIVRLKTGNMSPRKRLPVAHCRRCLK